MKWQILLARGSQHQTFALGTGAAQFRADISKPGVPEIRDGERLPKNAQGDRGHARSLDHHGIAVIGSLVEAGFGDEPPA